MASPYIGEIRMFAGNFAPQGWATCDGQLVAISDNDALFNLSSGEITVGEWAFFGHGVSVLTGTHDWRTFGKVRQTAVPKTGRDVVIEEGVWVSSGATIVGPSRIGANAVVAVGALVMGDVAPYTIVGGVPAKVLRTIPHDETGADDDQAPSEGDA